MSAFLYRLESAGIDLPADAVLSLRAEDFASISSRPVARNVRLTIGGAGVPFTISGVGVPHDPRYESED